MLDPQTKANLIRGLQGIWGQIGSDYLAGYAKSVKGSEVQGAVADRAYQMPGELATLWAGLDRSSQDALLVEAFPSKTRYGL